MRYNHIVNNHQSLDNYHFYLENKNKNNKITIKNIQLHLFLIMTIKLRDNFGIIILL